MPHILQNPAPLAALRDRRASTADFRKASKEMAPLLIAELQALLRKRKVDPASVVFVIILRSAIALLEPAIAAFPSAPIAVAGLKRDETTAKAYWYYENVPPLTKQSTVVILDPMLATGGSAEETVKNLRERGADLKHAYFVGVIAADEGVARLAQYIPADNLILGALDHELDAKKYIVPGLGDFGDRYFGYGEAPVRTTPLHRAP